MKNPHPYIITEPSCLTINANEFCRKIRIFHKSRCVTVTVVPLAPAGAGSSSWAHRWASSRHYSKHSFLDTSDFAKKIKETRIIQRLIQINRVLNRAGEISGQYSFEILDFRLFCPSENAEEPRNDESLISMATLEWNGPETVEIL